jgi:hypothetical protein
VTASRDSFGFHEENGWQGEVQGLRVSRTAAENKLTSLDRTARNHPQSDIARHAARQSSTAEQP